MVSGPFQCLTLSLLILPPLFLTILTTYFFATFPHPPEALLVYPSLASLPQTCKSWSIYPEDYYPGGAYATFPHGRVRYWVMGPEKGQKIVLVHGLSIPSIVWRDVAPQMAANGFRVLLFDLYGRGYSDAPQTAYDVSLYATQLALLMQNIRWDQAYIVGISMGSGIAASFTAQFPNLVGSKLALISPAGIIESKDMSRTLKFMSSPLVQTVTSSALFRRYLQHLANSNSTGSLSEDPIQEIVRIQSAHLPGYNTAIASSIRDGPLRGLSSSFVALKGRSVLVIHGTADTTVHYKYAPRIQALIPSSTLITIEHGAHDLTVSHPGQVCDALIDFFRDGR